MNNLWNQINKFISRKSFNEGYSLSIKTQTFQMKLNLKVAKEASEVCLLYDQLSYYVVTSSAISLISICFSLGVVKKSRICTDKVLVLLQLLQMLLIVY